MNHKPPMTETVSIRSQSEEQTCAVAAFIAKRLQGGCLLALEGPLGSGKTCFVRGLAQGLGIDAKSVSSPTFVIRHEYGIGAGPTLVHIDAYRLSGPSELESIGWNDLVADRTVILAVEWPSRIQSVLPSDRIQVVFEHAGQHSRTITITGPASIVTAVGELGASVRLKCPTCERPIESTSAMFPFCSERCRLADLGRWFDERFRTSRAIESDEELSD